MRLVAIVKGSNPSLVESLKMAGIHARQTEKNVVAELLRVDFNDPEKEKFSYQLPESLKNARILMDVVEEKKLNYATVICSIKGERLTPCYIPMTPPNGVHACFSSLHPLISVTAFKSGKLLVRKYEIRETMSGLINLRVPFLFEGPLGDLGRVNKRSFARFVPAAKAALQKSDCQNCQDIHFAITK